MSPADPRPDHAQSDDLDALRQLQQQNLPFIAGKLLHDLRNPVHSLRIGIEVFERLASNPAPEALGRAARYVAPARGSMVTLERQLQRLALYLGPASVGAIEPVPIGDWLADVCSLLRESPGKLEIEERVQVQGQACRADRARLSHAVLHWWFASGASGGVLVIEPDPAGRIALECRTGQVCEPGGAEMRQSVLEAAGALVVADGGGVLRLLLPSADSAA